MGFERWDIGGLQGGLVSTVKMSGLKLSICVSLAEECMPPMSQLHFLSITELLGKYTWTNEILAKHQIHQINACDPWYGF